MESTTLLDTTELARITELDARLELSMWSITASPQPCTLSQQGTPDTCSLGATLTF